MLSVCKGLFTQHLLRDARLDRFNYTRQTGTRMDESEQNTFLSS